MRPATPWNSQSPPRTIRRPGSALWGWLCSFSRYGGCTGFGCISEPPEFHAQLDGRVDERLLVARELHDTLLQSFQGLIPVFQTARNLLPGRAIGRRKCLMKVSTTRRTRLSRAATPYRICARNRQWIAIWVLCSTPPGRNWRTHQRRRGVRPHSAWSWRDAAAARSARSGRNLPDRPRNVAQCLPARARGPDRGRNPVRSRACSGCVFAMTAKGSTRAS